MLKGYTSNEIDFSKTNHAIKLITAAGNHDLHFSHKNRERRLVFQLNRTLFALEMKQIVTEDKNNAHCCLTYQQLNIKHTMKSHKDYITEHLYLKYSCA